MTYAELKREIKKAAKEARADGLYTYITYSKRGDGTEYLTSNFIENCKGITDNQIEKAEKEGLLKRDWDTYEVVV